MKRFFSRFFIFIGSLLLTISFGVVSVLFFKPNWIINPQNLDLVLRKTTILKSWSWKTAELDQRWIKWNERKLTGLFQDLCLKYDSPSMHYETCFQKISWDFDLKFSWGEGFKIKTIHPVLIRSELTKVSLKDKAPSKAESGPMEIWNYWQLLWSDLIPDIDGIWKKIVVKSKEQDFSFDLTLSKLPKQLTVKLMDFTLHADPEGFEILPPKKYPFPKKFDLLPPLYFYNLKLAAKMQRDGVPLTLTGALEVIGIEVDSFIKLPLHDDFSSLTFRKSALLATRAKILLPDISKSLSVMAKDPYRELPAPLNAMNGEIEVNIHAENTSKTEMVLLKSRSSINMSGGKQVLRLDILNEVPLNVLSFKPGAILLEADFKQVAIQLPRLSKKSPPPQFFPDKRFKTKPYVPGEVKRKNKGPQLTMHFEGTNEKALGIRSNLLDEILRLNFDLYIDEGQLQRGYVSAMPLKTTVFKRPINLKTFKVSFDHPQDPVLESRIVFPLPEYKVTLELEGPVSRPRYHFTSEPALPQPDIFSVLLFGRPMADLNQDDKTAAQKTNQILSQGILSLSVLYFFAGSPVEYVGFDPGSKNATAQFGLNSKTSLRVGGGQEGVNSSAIRRSLGKGWYLDTSLQNHPTAGKASGQNNYGVLLERIIAY